MVVSPTFWPVTVPSRRLTVAMFLSSVAKRIASVLLPGVSVAASSAVSPTASVSSLGETEISVARSSTLNVLVAMALPELLLLAVIFTVPGPTGFSLPVVLPMVATALSLEYHLTLWPSTLSV